MRTDDLDSFKINSINIYLKLMYRNTGPDVYDYNRGSYDPSSNHNAHHSVEETVTYGGHNNYPGVHTNTHQNGAYGTNELRKSQANRRESRFDEYKRRARDYKYNFFSMIDEPWNRCCEVGKCGTCPANECIAKKEPKLDWI